MGEIVKMDFISSRVTFLAVENLEYRLDQVRYRHIDVF